MHYYIWVMHCSWNLKKKKINKKIKKKFIPPSIKILFYCYYYFFFIFYPTVQISHLYLSQLSPLSQPSPPSAHPEAQLSSVHPLDPCRHRPSSPVQLWPTPSVNPAHWPKPQALHCHISDPRWHHPPHPSSKPSSVQPLSSLCNQPLPTHAGYSPSPSLCVFVYVVVEPTLGLFKRS